MHDAQLFAKHFRTSRCPETGEENCRKCSGEYCNTHFDKPCDCDYAERHMKPEQRRVDQEAKG